MRFLFTDALIPYRQQNGGDYSIPAKELQSEAVDPELVGFAAHVQHGL
jgi:NAD(P)H dehydrogenase (quinone)